VRGLGLRKINSVSELEDTPAVRGMILRRPRPRTVARCDSLQPIGLRTN